MLKDEAVPTIFSHMSGSSRKRISSLQREEKQFKKVMVEDAISKYNETVSIERKEASCCTSDLITVKDCGVHHFPKSHSVRTQYREEDFESNEESHISSWKTPLKIKFEKRKRTKEIATNTDLSFNPNSMINISVDHPNSDSDTSDDETLISGRFSSISSSVSSSLPPLVEESRSMEY